MRIWRARFQNFRPKAFKLNPWEYFENSIIVMEICKNFWKSQFCYLEKGALELGQAATTSPRQIERSVFLLDHNEQTWVYRLSGQPDVQELSRFSEIETDRALSFFLLEHNGQTQV